MLHVRDLTVARGGIAVLEHISLSVAPGEALVLRGPNGCGKTSLLRTLAGLQNALAGEIDGAEERLAYAGHSDGIKAMLSVRENLAFWAQVFQTSEIGAALEAYQLGPLSERRAGTLSAGQKRRLGLARLLVTGRPVWLLDEPTVSLDQAAVGMFARVVRAHLTGGGAAVIATHIDLGLDAKEMDLRAFRARPPKLDRLDEAYL